MCPKFPVPGFPGSQPRVQDLVQICSECFNIHARQVPAAGDQLFCLAAASAHGLELGYLVAVAGNDQRLAMSYPLKDFTAMVP